MKSVQGRKGFLHFAKCLDNKNLTEIEDQIRKITIPTLIIRGDEDVFLSASISEKLNTEIKGSLLLRIETGGHFIQEDEPERVSKAILNFINN
jgi:pimeloyl-ACP methyl ester carboxylesterase